MANADKVIDVFTSVLEVGRDIVNDELQYNTIEQWDSLAHMRLVAQLEYVFDIMLDTDDIIDMSSVLKAKEILNKYGVKF